MKILKVTSKLSNKTAKKSAFIGLTQTVVEIFQAMSVGVIASYRVKLGYISAKRLSTKLTSFKAIDDYTMGTFLAAQA